MFDFVRKHTKIMMFVMFLLIIPSFVLFGIDGYNRFRETGEIVARVDGHEITRGEWDAMHKSESDRLRASMPNLDARLLDSPQARYVTLERLVRERVLAQAADKFKLVTSDARLARNLAGESRHRFLALAGWPTGHGTLPAIGRQPGRDTGGV